MPTSTSPPLSRRGLLTASTAAAITALSACSGGRSGSTLSLYQTKPEAIGYFSQLAQDFTASQDRIRVAHDSSSNLSADFVRHNPPDLGCQNYNLEMARFMERGALSDLADMPEAGRIRADVLDLVDQYATYQGRTSVIPYSVTAAAVIYNKRIFDDHGLAVPQTWDELIDVCEKLTAAGVTPIYGTYIDPWTVAQGLFDYTVGGMVDVAAFYERLHAQGGDVGPDSEVSFATTLREPVNRMVTLAGYSNPDAASRAYPDGNTAMANGEAAMYLQGPWAIAEIDKAGTDIELGTFPLPVTDDPDDLKVRVNLDLALWVPESSDRHEEAREFLSYLMRPEVQDPYNDAFLAFGTTAEAPPATDERIAELQGFYDDSRFYSGASQFIPFTIPAANYLQAIVTGAEVDATLRRLDDDWARLASRQ